MAQNIYGNPISIGEANKMATHSMSIKTKYDNDIKTLTTNDPEGKRFYCGGDALYIFSKGVLQSLLDRITQPEDCLVIYPGCRNDEMGRPTLIATVYELQLDGKYHLMKDTTGGNGDGTEHPGGNGSFTLNKTTLPTGDISYEIPEIINPGDIHAFL